MKNPFIKEDNTTVIVSIVIGAVFAGILAYLYLTENGTATRVKIKHKVKENIKNVASDVVSKKTKIPKKIIKGVADYVVK